jgi:ATP-dependent DNA helicase RecG
MQQALSSNETKDVLNPCAVSVREVSGIGPRYASLLDRKGISTVEDALYFLPRTYEDRRTITRIANATGNGLFQTFVGTIKSLGMVAYRGNRKRFFKMTIADATGSITAKWFHFNGRSMMVRFKKNDQVILTGQVKLSGSKKEVLHPEIEILEPGEAESPELKKILPVYSETEGLPQKTIRRLIKRIVEEYVAALPDGISDSIRRRQNIMGLADALMKIHLPAVDDDFDGLAAGTSEAHRRLIFDELFFLQLGLAQRKRSLSCEKRYKYNSFSYNDKLRTILPYSLTAAQARAVDEIIADFKGQCPMNRLLQGDVGSGKTIVAFMASLIVIQNGYQAAFMAPTEILAEQHYKQVLQYAERLGLKAVLLTGGGSRSQKEDVYDDIAGGRVDMVIGTHAIVQEKVSFRNLGLAVIDEQHRFGVRQRAALKKKGCNADILIMTATPIPRTLGLTVYGDLDCSVIDEMPPGRVKVTTKLYGERDRKKVYDRIAQEIENQRQVFIVYPLVEESEKIDLKNATDMARTLQNEVFPGYRVGLLHGRMTGDEKEKIMADFKEKQLDILVSTTVVEVGIDVPNASLMVIEHAERFGLSQLHQLRGRVGRGEHPSHCILLAHAGGTGDAMRRLKIIEGTTDGFKIAEEDFNIRGPGEFLGVRQSGMPDLRIARALYDVKTLHAARNEAFRLADEDPGLTLPEHRVTRQVLQERWQGGLELADVG